MNRTSILRWRRAFAFASAVAAASYTQAQNAPASPPANASATPAQNEVIELTPFTVTSQRDAGYFAENTLAGSRLNTNLADLAASITIVTKQQMEDTASIDINDVFKYEASTKGSSTYSPSIVDRGTVKDTLAGYTYGNNGDSTTNAQSNRVRGLSAPDAAINNYSTNNRVPFDSYNTQSVEITRGPNSLLFGLGTPAGVVNQNTAQAALDQETNRVVLRTDHNGSYRASLAFNRPLIENKLALYGAFLYDNRQFERKPSSDVYRRQYGAITYRPFKNTIIRGFVEGYRNDANRPNFFTPRDQVTPWIQAGRPVYDPVTRMITMLDSGQVLGPYVTSSRSPGYNAAVNNVVGVNALTNTSSKLYIPAIFFDDVARPIRRIDGGEVIDFFARQPQFFAPAFTNPATATPSDISLGWTVGDPRYLIRDRLWTSSGGAPTPTASINGVTYTYGNYQGYGVTDQSIYDWTQYNTLETNFSKVRAGNYNLELEQQILPNLFFSAGFFRQDIDDTSNNTLNSLTGATLRIDTNKNMIDGTPNPYYLQPFMSEGEGGGLDTFYSPETNDNYRALLAYDLDLTKRNGWLSWLGRHRILGNWAKQETNKAIERWRMNFTGGDQEAMLRYGRNLTLTGQAIWSATATMRKHYMASPNDPGIVVTHSVGDYRNRGWDKPYTSLVQVWDYNTQNFKELSIEERIVFSNAGSFRTQREVDTNNFAIQSFLWGDRLVSTLGWRTDDYKARITTTGAVTDESGAVVEPALGNDRLYISNSTGEVNRELVMSRWNRWEKLSGDTKTLGAAFRPFRGLGFAQTIGGEGSLASEFLQSLTFYYNEADNFNPPATFQTDMFFRPLPKPTGEGKDAGIGFSLFENKLVTRVNWFETSNLNERTGAAGLLLGRAGYSDTTTGLAWASAVQRIRNGIAAGRTLQEIISVNNWNSEGVNPVGDEANQRKIYDLIQLPYLYYSGLSSGATQNSKAKGVEVQLTYNPSRSWTMKFTGSKNEASYTNVAPQYDEFIAERMPKWTTSAATDIPDFIEPGTGREWSLKNFWTGYGYHTVARKENTDGNTSAQAYFDNVVQSQVALAKALEGAVSPLQRKYRASFLTNYVFREGRFRGWSVGGSARWESKAAIGFYGKVGNPVNSPTVINLNDVTRPIYDDGNFLADFWISHTRKIYGDKVNMKLQLNVNNFTESGRLMPTQVNFDGTPWAYRIIDPRQFILTATFDF